MKKVLQLLVLGLLVVFSSCKDKQSNKTVEGDLRPEVKVVQVVEKSVPQIYEYSGTIDPEFKNNIGSSTSLRIEKILVEVGDFVKKGQRLVLMDTSNYTQLKLQLDNEKVEFDRVDELHKVGGVSKSEWDAAKMALDVRKAAYANLLENTALLSPIDGVVSARNYDNGDMYSSGNPILTIEKITPVKMLINISESFYANVKEGQEVVVKLDVYPEKTFNGQITIVYPTIKPETRTFTVEIKLSNKNKEIRPGMFARAEFNYGNLNRVVVPDVSIIKQIGSGDRYVYVYKDGKVSYTKVELGRRLGNEYELLSGVENNSYLVVAGQTRLVNGAEVKVIQ